jgi:thiol-disulfide isomerase/thioredoxin
MSKTVYVIGVSSPCPRCELVFQRVENLAKEMETPIRIYKIEYDDPEAYEFAASMGKLPGTAKRVAERAGIEIDWKQFARIYKNPPIHPEDIDVLIGTARQWSPHLDAILQPCQEKAESVGLIMTPIIVVDGQVKHHGSVPSMEALKTWLS